MEGTPYNCLYIPREALPKRGTIFRLHVFERAEISSVEVYESIGKSVVFGLKIGPKGQTDLFYGCEKVEKAFWFCNLFRHILKIVHLQQLKGM